MTKTRILSTIALAGLSRLSRFVRQCPIEFQQEIRGSDCKRHIQ